MSDEYDFDAPDHCTVGVIGEVGQRLFLFYCRQGLSETTVKVEKQQVAVLAGYLGRIVKELGRPGHLPEDLEFYGTEEFEWVVGTIGVSYDEELDRIIVVLEEIGVEDEEEDEDDDMESGHVLRVALDPRAGGRLRHPRHAPGGGGPAALPAVLAPAGPGRARLPAHQRAPATGDLAAVSDAEVERVLTEGDMEVHGRIAGSSNATLLVTCRLQGRGAARRLQAVQGRAAALGLPRRALPARGGRLRALRGAGLGPGARDGRAARGPVRSGLGAAVRPRGRHLALLHPPRRAQVASRAHAAVRVRRRGQQRRPQERPRPAGRGAAVGHRQRPLLQPPGQAAHRDLGLRRGAARARRARRTWPGWPTTGRRPRCASCSSRPRWPPPSTGWPGSSACAPCPSWSTTATGRRTPGRSSEAARRPGRAPGQVAARIDDLMHR